MLRNRLQGELLDPADPAGGAAQDRCGRLDLRLASRFGLWRALVLLSITVTTVPLFASSHPPNPPPQRLVATIPVAPLGYRAPGEHYMLTRDSFTTLGFLDSSHLLFTFHKFVLLKRERNSKPWDNDQMIQATVLNLPDGKVAASAEWRMHDRRRYLWPLGEGRFLVRQRNSYSIGDRTLALHPWIHSPERVAATEVSPDGRLLVVEMDIEVQSQEMREKLAEQSAITRTPPPAIGTGIVLVDIASRKTKAEFRTELPILLPVTSTGFLKIEQAKEDDYVIRYRPFEGLGRVLGDVRSTCTPTETFVNSQTVLISSCGPDPAHTYEDAWTIDGKALWHAERDGREVWPVYASALNGSRFAVGTLKLNSYVNLADSVTRNAVQKQVIRVIDTATGKLVFETDATPVITAGQNFALSPDGNQLAVLRHGAIEVFALPPVEHKEG